MTSYPNPISTCDNAAATPASPKGIKQADNHQGSPSSMCAMDGSVCSASSNDTKPATCYQAPPSSNSVPPKGITSSSHGTRASSTSYTTSPAPASVETGETFGQERITVYVGSRVDANPQYQHPSAEASIAAHIGAMRSVLDGIDVVMAGVGSGDPEKK